MLRRMLEIPEILVTIIHTTVKTAFTDIQILCHISLMVQSPFRGPNILKATIIDITVAPTTITKIGTTSPNAAVRRYIRPKRQTITAAIFFIIFLFSKYCVKTDSECADSWIFYFILVFPDISFYRADMDFDKCRFNVCSRVCMRWIFINVLFSLTKTKII